MGLRFKKSIKIAPGVKVNLNKNSTSVSVGTKGKHYTVNSKGKTTTTVGIPGTGLSYSTTSSGSKSKKTSVKSKTPAVKKSKPKKKGGCAGCLTPFLVVFGILFILGISGSSPELTDLKANWDTTEYDIAETAEITLSPIPDNAKIETLSLSENTIASLKYENGKAILSFKAEGSEELYFIANENVKSNTKTIHVIDSEAELERIAAEQEEAERIAAEQAEAERIAAEQAEAERIAQEQAEAERIAAEQAEAQRVAQEQAEAARIAQEQAAQQQRTQQMVWISATGSKYHSVPDCGRMNPDNAYQMSLSDAQANGYGRCSKCH